MSAGAFPVPISSNRKKIRVASNLKLCDFIVFGSEAAVNNNKKPQYSEQELNDFLAKSCKEELEATINSNRKPDCSEQVKKEPSPDSTGRDESTADINKTPIKNRKKYACKMCGKIFKFWTRLRDHMRPDPGRPFTCEKCCKKYIHRSALETHMHLKHTGKRPFKCDICTKTCFTKDALESHRLCHTQKKGFGCDLCDRTFFTLSSLKTHIRTHTGERPFVCDICQRGFARRCHLNRHAAIHSRQKTFACTICDKKFVYKLSYENHMLTHLVYQ